MHGKCKQPYVLNSFKAAARGEVAGRCVFICLVPPRLRLVPALCNESLKLGDRLLVLLEMLQKRHHIITLKVN